MPRTLRLLFGVSLLNFRALFGAVLLFSVLWAVPSIVLAATAPGKTYLYDAAGRIIQTTITDGSTTVTLNYTYDAAGNLISIQKAS
jgi:YD repeat-containing protein